MLHCSRTLQKNTVAYLLAADPTRPEEGGLVAGEQGLKANGDEVSQEELGLPDDHRVGWLEGGGVGSYLEILLLLEREWTVRP